MNSCSCVVSIHLMFLLIHNDLTNEKLGKSFNTSHVSINRLAAVWQNGNQAFQYISCFY